eukprot:874231-Prorocentrum_minimum.AAC.2
MVGQGIRHADQPPARCVPGGVHSRQEVHVSKKEAPTLNGGPREHDGHELSAEERHALNQQKDEVGRRDLFVYILQAHLSQTPTSNAFSISPAYRSTLEARVAEAAAHRQVRALNMEAGLKPSKRAKKEARAAAKKKAKGESDRTLLHP